MVVLLIGVCVVAVGCEALDATGTTAVGGGATGETTPAPGSAPTSAPVSAPDTGGGTWVTGESGNSILGKWHNAITGETLEFFPNGVVTGSRYADMKGIEVTYAISGDQLSISALGTLLVTQTFSIDGGTLTIIDNETGISGTLQRVE